MVRLGRFIRGRTISDAWHRGLNLIWRNGQEIIDERGTKIREILSLQVVVENPYVEMIPKEYSWNEERLEEYALQLLSADNPGFEYTYGERLRGWSVGSGQRVDQIEQAIRRLKASPSTRRATAVTWIPPVDEIKDEVPCMIVDDFKLRDGCLNLSVFFRSHDFAGAYPANLYGLARVLEQVAKEVGARPGSISTTSASAHVYEHDWDYVEEMLLGRTERTQGES
ncbi:MAG: thymidylate synthase [Methanothrix sp.]|nr:thymidylate synthase [Methanothrix sp.]